MANLKEVMKGKSIVSHVLNRQYGYNSSGNLSQDLITLLDKRLTIMPEGGAFAQDNDVLPLIGVDVDHAPPEPVVCDISSNEYGNTLISATLGENGVKLWNVETGTEMLSFSPGPLIRQARLMPNENDRSIASCSETGQVMHTEILEDGQYETRTLISHQLSAKKLAVDGPNIFYSCGADRRVYRVDLRTPEASLLFICPDESRTFGVGLIAMSIDPQDHNVIAVGGFDEYARTYDIRNCQQPVDRFFSPHLLGRRFLIRPEITDLAFSEHSELVVSYTNESAILVYTRQMGEGSVLAPSEYIGFEEDEAVDCVNFLGSHSEYVVAGTTDGRVVIWNKFRREQIGVMEDQYSVVKVIPMPCPNPSDSLLASCSLTKIHLWSPRGRNDDDEQ